MVRRPTRCVRDGLTPGLRSRRRRVRRSTRRGLGVRGHRPVARARGGARRSRWRSRHSPTRRGRASASRASDPSCRPVPWMPKGRAGFATTTESRWPRHLFESAATRSTSVRTRGWPTVSGCSSNCTWSRDGRWTSWTRPIAVASSIWPHGRWEFTFDGEANHAGSTRLVDRRDPMLAFASSVHSARSEATLHNAVATFGKVIVSPNGANAIPSRIRAWLDARAADEETLRRWSRDQCGGARHATLDSVALEVIAESVSPIVEFPEAPRARLTKALAPSRRHSGAADRGGPRRRHPVCRCANGDAVRPQPDRRLPLARGARGDDDCNRGAVALADVMADWITR